MKLSVLFDHQAFSRQSVGGVSRSFVELARQMQAISNVEASILAPLHWNSYLQMKNTKQFKIGIYQNIGIYRFWKLRYLINHTATELYCRRWPPIILHETWYSSVAYRIPHQIKIAITVHDLIFQVHPEWATDAAQRATDLAASVDRSDIIFCDTHHTRNDLLNWKKIDPQKVRVVHLGASELGSSHRISFEPRVQPKVDVSENDRFSQIPASCKLQNRSGLSAALPCGGRPYLLYVGDRASYKNFPALVKAFAASGVHRELALHCFGGGPFTHTEIELFLSLGLSDDCVLQFSGNDDALKEAYASALAFVYPSLYEGFGLPPLEAMSCDCPVVCSCATCLPEVCGDACLYFEPKDIESMSHALREIVENSTLREDLIRRGRKQVKMFTWEAMALKVLDAYSSVL
jgi:glycosyltransferase involved in cell wall biosynthesis